MALASAFELEYHPVLATDLGVIQRATSLTLHDEVKQIKRMLTTLIGKVRAAAESASKPRTGDGPTSPRSD